VGAHLLAHVRLTYAATTAELVTVAVRLDVLERVVGFVSVLGAGWVCIGDPTSTEADV